MQEQEKEKLGCGCRRNLEFRCKMLSINYNAKAEDWNLVTFACPIIARQNLPPEENEFTSRGNFVFLMIHPQHCRDVFFHSFRVEDIALSAPGKTSCLSLKNPSNCSKYILVC